MGEERKEYIYCRCQSLLEEIDVLYAEVKELQQEANEINKRELEDL